MSATDDILRAMPPILLSEMDSIRLMNRVDTKYLTDRRTLDLVLAAAAADGYLVFEYDGCRIIDYNTMYYDTADLRMYLEHDNRRLVRQKLRTRRYSPPGVTFLEVKSKNNHGRTKKKRISIPPELYCTDTIDDDMELEWLQGRLDYVPSELSPALETTFSRITLVNPGRTERSTIDMSVSFSNMRNGARADTGRLVIIEVKQGGNLPSRLREILLEHRVKPLRVSKYCIGTAMTDPDIKKNRFIPKLRIIDKLNGND